MINGDNIQWIVLLVIIMQHAEFLILGTGVLARQVLMRLNIIGLARITGFYLRPD
jgi:hypothetical protein